MQTQRHLPTLCITLLAFDGLLQVFCEGSGDGHSEVGSGFSGSGSTSIKQKQIIKVGKSSLLQRLLSTLCLTLKELLKLL